MAQIILGPIESDPGFLLSLTHPSWAWGIFAAVVLIGAIAFHFVRCAKRGVCPFPHGRKKNTAPHGTCPAGETSSGRSADRSRVSIDTPNETSHSAEVLSASAGTAPGPAQQSVPLAVTDPIRKPLLSDLQGNIISGHGRDHAVHLFIRFSADAANARAWLRKTAETYVVSAAVQQAKSKAFKLMAADGGIFGHISLSAAGYSALGFAPADFPRASNPRARSERNGYSDVFAAGMKSRQRYLLDPEVTHWEGGFQNEIHALVILAGDSDGSVNEAVDKVVSSLTDTTCGVIGKVVARENGMGLTRQLDPKDASTVAHVEHFGYVDGRSQPLFLEEQIDGEKKAGGVSTWDPSAPLSLALVRDPLGKSESSYGSFLVFRKLEQNVRGWNRAVKALADELGVKQELAGAMAMGRFKDGTPVVEQGTAGRTDVHNNFDFAGDPNGRRCPFQAHIRKTNPRGEAVGERDLTLEAERGHRIVRRGIPYGGALTTSNLPEEQPEGGVGLLFFCYQGDIWEQFEFIQRRWSNNPYFLQPQKSKADGYDATGLDPVIGQAHPSSQNPAKPAANWPKGWGNETTKVEAQLANFVTMKGGEYFFSPSMSFLLGL
jgi:Dyp-type peroxidase family